MINAFFRSGPPVIVSSPPNGKVKAGRSITLKCNHQDIDWYKEGSAESLGNKSSLTIRNASAKDEGTYQCAVKNGPKTSQKVIVIGRCFCFLLITICDIFQKKKKISIVVLPCQVEFGG